MVWAEIAVAALRRDGILRYCARQARNDLLAHVLPDLARQLGHFLAGGYRDEIKPLPCGNARLVAGDGRASG
jgi:hypothetical protein